MFNLDSPFYFAKALPTRKLSIIDFQYGLGILSRNIKVIVNVTNRNTRSKPSTLDAGNVVQKAGQLLSVPLNLEFRFGF